MRDRCDNPADPAFARYGGRGIAVCQEWERSFEAFRDWATAFGYAPNLTIDRIDNDKGYNPENCRWVTPRDQNRNRRDNRRIEFRCEMLLASEIAERHGIPADVMKNRIWRYGWPAEMAATTPVQPKGGKRALTFTAEQRNIDHG